MTKHRTRKSRIEIMVVTLPAYWACAIVNGDCSSMDDTEVSDMERELEALSAEGWSIIDVARDKSGEPDESRFTSSFRLYGGNCAGGDVLDYVAIRDKR